MLLLATKAEEENGLANYLSTILFGKEILPGISTVFHHLTFIHVQNFHPETFRVEPNRLSVFTLSNKLNRNVVFLKVYQMFNLLTFS